MTIDVSEDLTLPESGYLFLFAQSSDSGNMPLAVVKQPLTELPVTIKLTARDAMVAQLAMSVGQKVTVTARISGDETIDVSEGDLQGQREDLIVSDHLVQLNLTIDRRLGEKKL